MRLPGRRPALPAADKPVVPDAAEQAAWDADRARLHPRRQAILGLGLAALLVVAVLVVARARGDGDILALGSSPKSTSTLPPITGLDPIPGDPLFEASQLLAPGDPAAPGAAPAGGLPGAAGTPDPTGGGGAGACAAAGGGAGGQTGGGGAATPGDQSGGVAGGGVPIPTTQPGSSGGTSPTTQAGGGTPATTTTVPGQTPPPPSCSVSNTAATPSGARLKGQSGKVDVGSTRVEFRQANCGSAFRVQLNGREAPASSNGNLFVATVSTDQSNWTVRNYPISILNETTTIATVLFSVSP